MSSFFAGNEHVERLHPERTALAVGAFNDTNRVVHASAVAKCEDGDHKLACEVNFVVESSCQRSIASGEFATCG